MKNTRSKSVYLLLVFTVFSLQYCGQISKTNSLTKAEKKAGWKLLFSNNSTSQWRGYSSDSFPASGWTVNNGVVECNYTGAGEKGSVGDIITKKQYKDFELSLEWKISRVGNSGILYRVKEIPGKPAWHGAPEFQIIDGANYYEELRPEQLSGSVYDLYAAHPQNAKPFGEWNQARIVVNDGKAEHWQNGTKVAEYIINSQDMKNKVKDTKFAEFAEFNQLAERGHICLQDHGGGVWFRNVKIREL